MFFLSFQWGMLFALLFQRSQASTYALKCPTTHDTVEAVMRDDNGEFVIRQDANRTIDTMNNNRQLRHRTLAITMTRLLEEIEENNNETETVYLKKCLCQPSSYMIANRGDIGDIYCPEEFSFCGVFWDDKPSDCFNPSISSYVTRNALPIICLWYLGIAYVCCISIRGTMARDCILALLFRERNENAVERISSGDTLSSRGWNRWNCWLRRRDRFETQLRLRSDWLWRQEETRRDQLRRQRGLKIEMRTKHFTFEDVADKSISTQQSTNQDTINAEDESLDEPSCSICLISFEEGDRIGALECDHNFHVDCLKSWLSRKNTCPLCSRKIGELKEHNPITEEAYHVRESSGFCLWRRRQTVEGDTQVRL